MNNLKQLETREVNVGENIFYTARFRRSKRRT